MRDSLPSSSDRLPQLDAMRAVAAMSVVLYHCHLVFGGFALFSRGYLAVDFFFLLSGFVLNASVAKESSIRQESVRFIIRRILRLWPVMMLGVLLGFEYGLLAGGWLPDTPVVLLSAMIFLPRLGPAGTAIFPLNSVQWSLLLELCANAAHVLVLSRLSTHWLLALSVGCLVVLTKCSLQTGKVDYGATSSGWALGFLRLGYAYSLGCILSRYRNVLATIPAVSWWIPLLALTLLLMGSAPTAWTGGLSDSLTLLAFAPVLAAAAGAMPPKVLHKAMCLVGALSWPLYALHFPIMQAVHLFAGPLPLSSTIKADIATAISLMAAWAVTRSAIAGGLKLRSSWLRNPKEPRSMLSGSG